jgi:hypothetical protein
VTVELQNHSDLRELHELYADALFQKLRANTKIGPGACYNCQNDRGHNYPFSSPNCPSKTAGCVRAPNRPFNNQKALVRLLNFSTALRFIHNLDSGLAQHIKT